MKLTPCSFRLSGNSRWGRRAGRSPAGWTMCCKHRFASHPAARIPRQRVPLLNNRNLEEFVGIFGSDLLWLQELQSVAAEENVPETVHLGNTLDLPIDLFYSFMIPQKHIVVSLWFAPSLLLVVTIRSTAVPWACFHGGCPTRSPAPEDNMWRWLKRQESLLKSKHFGSSTGKPGLYLKLEISAGYLGPGGKIY